MLEKIMIDEDDRITAEDIHDILKDLGYIVTAVVASGEEALRAAEQTKPDLVLMNIRIKGDMDGIEVARKIRERLDTPTIYLSAHTDYETRERARVAEPLAYLVKPFQEPDLQACVEMVFGKSQ